MTALSLLSKGAQAGRGEGRVTRETELGWQKPGHCVIPEEPPAAWGVSGKGPQRDQSCRSCRSYRDTEIGYP